MSAEIIPFPNKPTGTSPETAAKVGDCVALHIQAVEPDIWATFPVARIDGSGSVEAVILASGITAPVWMVAKTPKRHVFQTAQSFQKQALYRLYLCHRAFRGLSELLGAAAILDGAPDGGAA